MQLENENLQRQLEQFKSEIHEIKNQEVTVRRLEDKLHEYETQVRKEVDWSCVLSWW